MANNRDRRYRKVQNPPNVFAQGYPPFAHPMVSYHPPGPYYAAPTMDHRRVPEQYHDYDRKGSDHSSIIDPRQASEPSHNYGERGFNFSSNTDHQHASTEFYNYERKAFNQPSHVDDEEARRKRQCLPVVQEHGSRQPQQYDTYRQWEPSPFTTKYPSHQAERTGTPSYAKEARTPPSVTNNLTNQYFPSQITNTRYSDQASTTQGSSRRSSYEAQISSELPLRVQGYPYATQQERRSPTVTLPLPVDNHISPSSSLSAGYRSTSPTAYHHERLPSISNFEAIPVPRTLPSQEPEVNGRRHLRLPPLPQSAPSQSEHWPNSILN